MVLYFISLSTLFSILMKHALMEAELRGPNPWLPISPDLTPLHFSMHVFVKSKIYIPYIMLWETRAELE
jgi:hypothetical protein